MCSGLSGLRRAVGSGDFRAIGSVAGVAPAASVTRTGAECHEPGARERCFCDQRAAATSGRFQGERRLHTGHTHTLSHTHTRAHTLEGTS